MWVGRVFCLFIFFFKTFFSGCINFNSDNLSFLRKKIQCMIINDIQPFLFLILTWKLIIDLKTTDNI